MGMKINEETFQNWFFISNLKLQILPIQTVLDLESSSRKNPFSKMVVGQNRPTSHPTSVILVKNLILVYLET